MSDNASGTPDDKRPDSSGNPPPSDPTASPSWGESAPPTPGQDPWQEFSDPHQSIDPHSGMPTPSQPPPDYGTPTPPPPSYGTTPPPPDYGSPTPPPPSYGSPPGYGSPTPPPGYGGTPPPGYGGTPPPGYGSQTPPPGYGAPGQPPYGAPGYGIPGQPPPPPGYGVPGGYGGPGYGAPGYDPSGYSLPSGYYAGPDDPLVSPDFAGWWRRGFTLLGAVWQPMTAVQLVWAVPLLAVSIVGTFVTPDATAALNSANPDLSDLLTPFALVLPFALITFVLSMVAQLATLDILVQRATGQPVSVGQALRTGLTRFFPLLGWQLLAAVVMLVGFLFCILPGLYFAVVFLILPSIILLERGEGISRAFQLFHSDFGAAFGRAAAIVGLYIAFILVEGVFSTAVNPSGTAGTGVELFLTGVSTIFSVASGVVITPLILTAYADMRARHEPFSTAYLVPQPYGK